MDDTRRVVRELLVAYYRRGDDVYHAVEDLRRAVESNDLHGFRSHAELATATYIFPTYGMNAPLTYSSRKSPAEAGFETIHTTIRAATMTPMIFDNVASRSGSAAAVPGRSDACLGGVRRADAIGEGRRAPGPSQRCRPVVGADVGRWAARTPTL